MVEGAEAIGGGYMPNELGRAPATDQHHARRNGADRAPPVAD
jgi:hypothetical protein